MPWEHFEVRKTGICHVQRLSMGEFFDARYRLEFISTGKQRVYWGNQLVIELPEMSIVGRVKAGGGSYISELKLCNAQLEDVGLRLLVAGNDSTYYVTGLTESSGFGYINGHKKAVHIMQRCPDHV